MSDFRIRMNVDLDASKAKAELQDLINSAGKDPVKLKVDTTDIKSDIKEISSMMKKLGSSSDNVLGGKGTSKALSQYKQLINQQNALQKQLAKETNSKSIALLEKQLDTVGKKILETKSKLTGVDKAMAEAFDTTATQKLEASLSKTFSSLESKTKNLATQVQSAFNNQNIDMFQLTALETKLKNLQNSFKNFDMSKMTGKGLNNLATDLNRLESEFKQVNNAANQLKLEKKFDLDCSKAINELNQLEQAYKKLGRSTDEIKNLKTTVSDLQTDIGKVDLGNLKSQLGNVTTQIGSLKQSTGVMNAFKSATKSTFAQIRDSFMDIAPGYLIGNALVSGISAVKDEILDLDRAMTNYKKVADEAVVDSQKITQSAVEIAKATGTGVADTVNSMAEATKLGFGGKAAQEVAKYAQIFANIGDMDVGAATQGIATVLNAFNIDPLKKFKVEVNGTTQEVNGLSRAMDVLNHADNNYAIGMDGVITALQNGGSTLASYGMTLEESTALITAANEAIQNPAKVGNGLKSISNNLAGLTTSAKDGKIRAGSGNIGQVIRKDKLVRETKPLIFIKGKLIPR